MGGYYVVSEIPTFTIIGDIGEIRRILTRS